MYRSGVEPSWDESLHCVGAGGGLEGVVDSLEARCLLVHFVDPVLCESQRGRRLSGMRVHSEEFGDIGFFSSIFLECVADARGELR